MPDPVTGAMAKTLEDTKSFVDEATRKMNTATQLMQDNVATANQAMGELQAAKDLLEQAKVDLAEAVSTLSDGVDAANGGDVIGLASTVAKGVAQVIDAVKRYTKVVAEYEQKYENYRSAVAHNVEVLDAF